MAAKKLMRHRTAESRIWSQAQVGGPTTLLAQVATSPPPPSRTTRIAQQPVPCVRVPKTTPTPEPPHGAYDKGRRAASGRASTAAIPTATGMPPA